MGARSKGAVRRARGDQSPVDVGALDPRALRRRARRTLIQAAVGAGVSEVSWRVFEVDRERVTERVREKCNRYVRDVLVPMAAAAA